MTYAAAQLPFILIGSLVPVLAWRLAADVAHGAWRRRDRLHAIALGTGLTCAVYLHLVLFSALTRLDDRVRGTGPRCASADGAGAARPARRARWTDPRLIGAGRAPGPGGADPERGGLAGPHLGRSGLDRGRDVARGAGPAHRGGGHPGDLVFAPWAIRNLVVFGSPLPGQAVTNAFSVTGHRHLRLERPADPVALPRGRSGPAHRDAGRGPAGTTSGRCCCCRASRCRSSGSSPCRGRAATARPDRSSCWPIATFLVTSLLFPVATTWGTFLHAAVPAHVVIVLSAHPRAGRGPRLARVGVCGWTRPVAWLGRGPRGVLRPPLLARPPAVLRRRVARHAGVLRGARAPPRGRRRAARPRRRTRSSATSRSGSPRPRACGRSGCPTSHRPTSSTWPSTFGARLLILTDPAPTCTGRPTWRPAPTAPPASPRSTLDHRPTPAATTRWPRPPSTASAAPKAAPSRPLYSVPTRGRRG